MFFLAVLLRSAEVTKSYGDDVRQVTAAAVALRRPTSDGSSNLKTGKGVIASIPEDACTAMDMRVSTTPRNLFLKMEDHLYVRSWLPQHLVTCKAISM